MVLGTYKTLLLGYIDFLGLYIYMYIHTLRLSGTDKKQMQEGLRRNFSGRLSHALPSQTYPKGPDTPGPIFCVLRPLCNSWITFTIERSRHICICLPLNTTPNIACYRVRTVPTFIWISETCCSVCGGGRYTKDCSVFCVCGGVHSYRNYHMSYCQYYAYQGTIKGARRLTFGNPT